MIVNISMKMSKPFYKLIAMGLGAEYAFQVFLTVGGAIKFIPMTGITLPLVSLTAAPTLNLEYGAYAPLVASIAL